MRDRMERFVVLPFSVGCISDSSVAVAALCESHKRSSKSHSNTSHPQEIREDEEENMKISTGIHRLFKSLKTISQLFAYKEGMGEEDVVGMMEIGMPTNVRHVSHIGWESALNAGGREGRGWEHLIPPELLADATTQDVDYAPLLRPSSS